MKLTRCEKKHFYDADKFDTCPHCEKETPKENKYEMDRPERPDPSSGCGHSFTSTSSLWTQGGEPVTASFSDVFVHHPPAAPPPAFPPNNKSTYCGNCGVPLGEDSPFCTQCGERQDQFEDAADINISEDIPVVEGPGIPQKPPSLLSQVAAVSQPGPSEDVKTMAFYDFAGPEPVVGWLVCIKGEYVGQSFNLKAGQNFIGRALNMDVALAKDTSVSRNKHTIITYDPQNRVFYIKPGESNGLTYVEGTLMLNPQQINAYEKVRVGNSELVFVPCCGDQFTWEDYL